MVGSVPSVLVRSRRCSRTPPRPHGSINTNEKEDKEKKMTDRDQYTPGPASGAQVRKDGEKWTLILVRELRHSPEKSLAGAYRPSASARVGALRRRSHVRVGRM